MKISTRQIQKLVGLGAILVPFIHTLTDIFEWAAGDFSVTQLWANYFAFISVPFMIIGLYAVQRPKIEAHGLLGAILYGASFVYFSHTTLFALEEHITNYESLWERLGTVYTLHGLVMIVGGIAFGAATYKADIFPKFSSVLFLSGIFLNLILWFFAAPDIFQTLGSALRNLGLMTMGIYLLYRLNKSKQAE